MIEHLKAEGEKVTSVSCGFKHAICKTSLGKVYTWGWGEKGQLGHGSYENEYSPRLVIGLYPQQKTKTLMVQAGYKHSMALQDNRRIFWWGTNASLSGEAIPTELNLHNKIPDMNSDFVPTRLFCSWSKSLNVS